LTSLNELELQVRVIITVELKPPLVAPLVRRKRGKRSISLHLISTASQSRMRGENTLRNVLLRPDLAAQTKHHLRYSRICHLLCTCIFKRTQVFLESHLSHLPSPCRYNK